MLSILEDILEAPSKPFMGVAVDQVKLELACAASQLSSRGLLHSCKWVAEFLDNVNENCFAETGESTELNPVLLSEGQDASKYILAKACFDLKEYCRAAHILRDCNDSKSIFLRCYALLLAGEKRKQERQEIGGQSPVFNEELKGIRETLDAIYKKKELDGFGCYLYAVVLGHMTDFVSGKSISRSARSELWPSEGAETSIKNLQKQLYISSICLYPWNWSAWLNLTTTIDHVRALPRVESCLPSHYFKPFWLAHAYLELQQNQEALSIYKSLDAAYPNNGYIKCQMAMAHHNMLNLDPAQALFEQLLQHDPYRLTGIDMYSNILYIKEDRPKLSHLAYTASVIDKYTPETCCVIGNYYSLHSEHEKAALYFERALKLNPRYLAAWTLIGHEYIEMKNIAGAITAYRKAVDINRHDYRAWYSLGQTYELLRMPLYALYYFERACELRPYDARMWCAMAGCYESINHLNNAILCYKRAEANEDKQGIVYNKLGKLFQKLGKREEAAHYYKKNLDQRERESLETQDVVDALLFLAHYSKHVGDIQNTVAYCSRLLDFAGREKEEAKAILREIHSSQNLKAMKHTETSPNQSAAIGSFDEGDAMEMEEE